MNNDKRPHVEGIYFNSADSPIFLEGRHIGGHDYVYLEGYFRVPGNLVLVQDPKDDPNAPETFHVAYERMMEKGRREKRPTRINSQRDKSNVIPVDDKEEDTKPKPTKPARSRKGGSDTTSSDEASQ